MSQGYPVHVSGAQTGSSTTKIPIASGYPPFTPLHPGQEISKAEAEANLSQLVEAIPERLRIVVAFHLHEELDPRPALSQSDPRRFLAALWDWGRLTWKTAPQPWRGVRSWRERNVASLPKAMKMNRFRTQFDIAQQFRVRDSPTASSRHASSVCLSSVRISPISSSDNRGLEILDCEHAASRMPRNVTLSEHLLHISASKHSTSLSA
jgi:hypothetical protein